MKCFPHLDGIGKMFLYLVSTPQAFQSIIACSSHQLWYCQVHVILCQSALASRKIENSLTCWLSPFCAAYALKRTRHALQPYVCLSCNFNSALEYPVIADRQLHVPAVIGLNFGFCSQALSKMSGRDYHDRDYRDGRDRDKHSRHDRDHSDRDRSRRDDRDRKRPSHKGERDRDDRGGPRFR